MIVSPFVSTKITAFAILVSAATGNHPPSSRTSTPHPNRRRIRGSRTTLSANGPNIREHPVSRFTDLQKTRKLPRCLLAQSMILPTHLHFFLLLLGNVQDGFRFVCDASRKTHGIYNNLLQVGHGSRMSFCC